MATVRVAPSTRRERLVRVALADVDPRVRDAAARRLRDQRWEWELRPGENYSPTQRQRSEALLEAAALCYAASYPHGSYVLPQWAVEAVLNGG